MKKETKKQECVFENKKYKIEHYDFLPPDTIGLPTNLFKIYKRMKEAEK